MKTHTLRTKMRLDGTTSVGLTSGVLNRIVVERPRLLRLTHSHLRYSLDSAFPTPAPWNDGQHPLAALAEAAIALDENPEMKLVLCGHASASGSTGHNLELSQDRASALLAIASEARQDWVRIVTRSGSIQDIKAYLNYLYERRRWTCFAGEIDLQEDEAVRAGVSSFQQEYNARFDGELLCDGICGKKTLGAIFDVQRLEFVSWLEKFGLAPSALRAQDAVVVAAGSDFAGRADTQAEHESADRIVDLFLVSGDDVGEAQLSPDILYGRIPKFVDFSVPDQPGDWEYGSLLIVTDLHPEDADLQERYRLIANDGSFDVELAVSQDGLVQNGGIELHFEKVPTSSSYDLIVTSHEGVRSKVFTRTRYAEFHRLSTSLPSSPPER